MGVAETAINHTELGSNATRNVTLRAKVVHPQVDVVGEPLFSIKTGLYW
jgi:hypothetical protein